MGETSSAEIRSIIGRLEGVTDEEEGLRKWLPQALSDEIKATSEYYDILTAKVRSKAGDKEMTLKELSEAAEKLLASQTNTISDHKTPGLTLSATDKSFAKLELEETDFDLRLNLENIPNRGFKVKSAVITRHPPAQGPALSSQDLSPDEMKALLRYAFPFAEDRPIVIFINNVKNITLGTLKLSPVIAYGKDSFVKTEGAR